MRILVIGAEITPDSMEKHVVETLQEMSHDVRHFNIRSVVAAPPSLRPFVQYVFRNTLREPERLNDKKLLRVVHEFQPELGLVLHGANLSPKTVDRIRRAGVDRIVCWSQDQMTTLGRQYLIGSMYDKVFLKDHYLVDALRNFCGIDAHYLPEACNPRYHTVVELSADEQMLYKSDICTFGNVYYFRQAILQSLVNYDLQVWGHRPDWLIDRIGDHFKNRPVFEIEKSKVIRGARIVLNTLHFGEIDGVNCRAFEVAGCGGFQLVSLNKALARHFVIGEELETFSNLNELREKVDYYLQHPARAEAIARAGHQRAVTEHTYERRLTDLLAVSTS